MGKTFSIKVLFGIYLLLMAGKVFAFSCNVDGGSSIGAGTTSVYVNLDPVIQPGQNLVVDLSQHISCWNDYGGWYDTDHINLVQGSAFAGSLQSYKGSLYWNNVTYPFPLTTNTNVLDIGDKTPMPLPLKLYITPVGAAGGVVIKAGEVIARIHMYKIATLGSGNPRNFTWNIISNNSVVMPTGGCTVDSRNVTVNLPDFPGSAEIPLGVYCSSEQKLSFYLSGATTDSARQVFANAAPDATKASGVGVSLIRNGKILATGENVSLGTVNKSKVPLGLSATYYNVRIGGDMALLKGMMRLLIERDDAASAAGRPSLLDDEFIQTNTVGFDELRRDVLNSEWKDIERISGLSQTQIAELADAYAAAERTIICYGMGITQHEHGTQNVQQLVNLLLMKGNIGKPGAGICPLRGHSNVQGDRTVGITEKPSAEFLDRLCERYGFTPPHAPGHAAIASMQAICTGQARALICMGGNFALAMPDREASAVPLTQLDLAVHVATKLNRSHLLTARHSYILPVLGRSEIDMQKSGAQAVTVEDSMSMIHASRGVLKPAGVMLKSECAVVAGIAQAALPQSVVAWEYLVEDYDRIRNDIEAVLPEFADYNQRIRHPGGFHLINAAAERRWMTSSGKANFITSKGLLEDPSSAFNSKLVMATVRSHDQYNTTIYGMDDRYRGVFGQRDVVFMSAKQAKICRVKNGERVNLIALTPDGKRSSRRMDRLKVVIYPMADRSLVTYFPESNHMLTLDNHDPLSGIPGYKSIPVELEPSN